MDSFKVKDYVRVDDLTSDKGVIKRVIREGILDGGAGGAEDLIALPGQDVIIVYECHLATGPLVDSSKEHEGKAGIACQDGQPGIRIKAGTGEVI